MTNPKNYYRPQTLAEALERSVQPGSVALAGGALTLGGILLPYETLIDLQDLDELKHITADADGIHIGGAVRFQEVVDSPLIPDILKQALQRALTPNLRNGASVIESLITANPPREWLAALVALGTEIEHAGNLPGSEESKLWQQSLEEFIHYFYQHGRIFDGVIVHLRIPPQAADLITGTAFVARTPADHPIVNTAVAITPAANGNVEKAVAVLGGASAEPIVKLTLPPLEGKPLDDVTITAAAAYIESHVIPVSNYQGSLEYRQQMAQVCVRRALEACLEQWE